ncbi:MAG: MmcQ/YjbR family DNA-binding protein [Chitinophagales bacterium]
MKADFIRSICFKFPDVTEDIKWQHDLCFMVGGKIFCVTGIEGDFGVSIKVLDEEMEELCTKIGIVPAPYLARYKWVLVTDPKAFSKKEWEYYLRQSFDLIKAKQKPAKKNTKKDSKIRRVEDSKNKKRRK